MSTEGSGASRARGQGIHNEDAFLVEDGLGLYVVCDGASASGAGETAARIARDAVVGSIERSEENLDLRYRRVANFVVDKAMKDALRALTKAEQDDPEVDPFSTTITLFLAHRSRGVIGHRGDSRAYLIRRERVAQLTVDQEFTEGLPESRSEAVDFEVFGFDLRAGDTIVLSTDGAEQVVEESWVADQAGSLAPRLLASRIVSAAHRQDDSRDATAVVVRVKSEREKGWLELSEQPDRVVFGHTLRVDGSRSSPGGSSR